MNLYKRTKDPDLFAPRFRPKRHNLISRETYKKFLSQNPKLSMEYGDFKFIVGEINLEIRNQAINNREGIILPKGLGRIWLGLFPPNRKHLIETGNLEFNFHSGNMKGKIGWDYDHVKYKIENNDFYGFLACRDFKGQVSRAFIEHSERFMRIDYIVRMHEGYKTKKLEENERRRLDDTISNQSDQDTTQTS